MKIDKHSALKVLEEESRNSGSCPNSWIELIDLISTECQKDANKTFIALLGTALLARATDIRADPFSLKAGFGTPGAYSARSLCKEVLAANALRLRIDLGVTGREPLNNQPFFAEGRVHDNLQFTRERQRGLTYFRCSRAHIQN